MSRNRGGKGGEPCDYREQRFSPTIGLKNHWWIFSYIHDFLKSKIEIIENTANVKNMYNGKKIKPDRIFSL